MWVIIAGLIICGVTAFPLQAELEYLNSHLTFFRQVIRHIPLFWLFVDSCFGVIASVPLYIGYWAALRLEALG